jgi:hypothetical protein
MATEKLDIDPKTLDRRIAARLVRRGMVTEKELEKAYKGLPDAADKAVPIEVELDDDEG